MIEVIFIDMASNEKLHKAQLPCAPIKGQGIQIKKVDYIVIAVKWFFNDYQVINVLVEQSKP